jgi:hypothetical protein
LVAIGSRNILLSLVKILYSVWSTELADIIERKIGYACKKHQCLFGGKSSNSLFIAKLYFSLLKKCEYKNGNKQEPLPLV